jgi:hypothetical protein
LGLPFSTVDGVLRRLGFEPAIGSRGSGKPRRWSLADIVAVKIGSGCVKRGGSWQTAREVMRRIKTGRIGRGDQSCVVVLCGRDVWVTRPENLPGLPAGEPVFVWDLPSCFAEVQRQLAELAGSSQGPEDARPPQPAGQPRIRRRESPAVNGKQGRRPGRSTSALPPEPSGKLAAPAD